MLTEESYPNVLAAAHEILEYAQEHYDEGGWDLIVEAHTPESLAEHLCYCGDTTAEEAWASARLMAEHWAEKRADAENSRF